MNDHDLDNYGFATRVIHAAQDPKEGQGALATPIYLSSTFCFDDIAGYIKVKTENEGYTYTRSGNPTNRVLEKKLAVLECGEDCVVTASGMGAIGSTLLSCLKCGDHVVCGKAVYGPTAALMRETLPDFGIETTFVDSSDVTAVWSALTPKTKILYFEVPSNPNLLITDITEMSGIAHEIGALLIIDNTFAPPPIQYPLKLGANIVVHSLTKYINGHGDVLGGAVIGSKEIIDTIKTKGVMRSCGTPLSPMNSYLVLRGMKTLDLRIRRHCDSALQIARYLEFHPYVQKVFYPGLESFEGHDVAKKQMNGLYSGIMAFDLNENIKGLTALEAGQKLLKCLKIPKIAVSLGDPDSLIEQPAAMTHRTVPKQDREAAGISDGLIRFSVGLEDPQDIIHDFEQAMALL